MKPRKFDIKYVFERMYNYKICPKRKCINLFKPGGHTMPANYLKIKTIVPGQVRECEDKTDISNIFHSCVFWYF